MKVSIIVPIYKAELYILDCFESINSQTYKDVEIIFVDDGSPDNSGQIADSLSENNPNVKVIHKSNGGASSARNIGVKEATGEYLLFIDSDDFLRSTDSLERLVSYVQEKDFPDLVGFNISYYYPSRNKYTNWVEYSVKITNAQSKDALIQELVKSGTLPVSPCGKMIKRDAYMQSGIKFIEGTIGEDIPWTIQLYDNVSSIYYISEYHYCYRQEVESSVTGSFSKKKYLDLVAIVENLIPLINNTHFSALTKEFLLSFAAYELSIAMSDVYKLKDYDLRKNIRTRFQQLCWLFKYTQNPKVRIVSKAYNMFGYAITERLLRIYNWYRTKK